MSLADPVIAVIGAGAIGQYYGARLIQHGHRVHLLTRTDCDHIKKSGIHIESRDGNFSLHPLQVNVHGDPRQIPKADLVLVTLKTTANSRLEELIRPVLKDESVILTLQNGLGNEDELADLFGPDRIMGGMAFVCINRVGPGQISHTDHGMIRIGEPKGGISDRARRISEIFSKANVPCAAVENLHYGRWEKLVWNVPFNGLGAALLMTTDQLIGSDHGLSLVRRLMHEVIQTCNALGISMELSVTEEKIRYTQTMGAYKTSMQIDREVGRLMEVESVIGRPLQEARKRGVSTPCIEMLYGELSVLNSTMKHQLTVLHKRT
jgi:2-dehydropantoate 2-reductase